MFPNQGADFHAWFTLSLLHVWLIMVRLRRDTLALDPVVGDRNDTTTKAATTTTTTTTTNVRSDDFRSEAVMLSEALFATFWQVVKKLFKLLVNRGVFFVLLLFL